MSVDGFSTFVCCFLGETINRCYRTHTGGLGTRVAETTYFRLHPSAWREVFVLPLVLFCPSGLP